MYFVEFFARNSIHKILTNVTVRLTKTLVNLMIILKQQVDRVRGKCFNVQIEELYMMEKMSFYFSFRKGRKIQIRKMFYFYFLWNDSIEFYLFIYNTIHFYLAKFKFLPQRECLLYFIFRFFFSSSFVCLKSSKI